MHVYVNSMHHVRVFNEKRRGQYDASEFYLVCTLDFGRIVRIVEGHSQTEEERASSPVPVVRTDLEPHLH